MWPRRVEIHVVDEQNKSYVVDAGFLSDPSLIIALPVCPWVSLSLSPCCENWLVPRPEVGRGTWLMWPLRVKIHATSPKVTQFLLALPAVVSFDSHVVDIGTKQKPCCWCRNKTKDMLLMPEQNKRHVVDAVFLSGPSQSHCHALLVSPSVTPCFEDAEFTQPLLAHDELNCWIFQNCYMDFSYL